MAVEESAFQNWVESQVLRATRNSLIWNGVSLGLLMVLVWLTGDYLFYFFRGPVGVNDSQLLEIIERNRARSPMEYIELRDRQLISTNWKEVTTRDGKPYASVPYFLLPVGDQRMIVVQAETQADGRHLLGPLNSARDMDRTVISGIVRKQPEYEGRILPIVLSTVAAFNVAGYVLLTFLLPWGGYCIWNVVRASMSRVNPSLHAIEQQLGKWGDSTVLATSINDEVNAASRLQFGKAILTDSWILRPTVFGAICVRLQDVVWVYHVQRSSESFAVLCLRNGKMTGLFLRRQQVEEILPAISRRAPWALIGYDLNRLKQWQKNRAEIIRQSDEQRTAP